MVVPWRSRSFLHFSLSRRSGRPQLKRDPLGGGLPGAPCAHTVSVWTSALSDQSPMSKRSPPAQAFGNSLGYGGAMAELGEEAVGAVPKASFEPNFSAFVAALGGGVGVLA